MCRRGDLSFFRLGKLIRIPANEVERVECLNTGSSSTEDSGASPTDGREFELRQVRPIKDRGLAEARASAIWRTLQRPASERVADLWEAYVTDRIANGGSESRIKSLWKTLEPSFGYKLGKAITKQDCRDYAAMRKRLGKSPSTIKTELEALRACLRWHYGKEAPVIVAPSPSKPRERYLTQDEARRLLEHIEAPHVRLFVTLALATGARMGAILDLTWDRVDFEHQTIDFMPAGRDKTNKRRVVVRMAPKAREALLEASQAALSDHVIEYGGKPVASVKRAIAAAARRSGIPCSPTSFGTQRPCGWLRRTCRCRRSVRSSATLQARSNGDRLCPLFAPVHGRGDGRSGLVAGSREPPDAYGKRLWAVRDSNSRPSRCKSEPPSQICRFLGNVREGFAKGALCGQVEGGSR
jgi:integrase